MKEYFDVETGYDEERLRKRYDKMNEAIKKGYIKELENYCSEINSMCNTIKQLKGIGISKEAFLEVVRYVYDEEAE